VLFVAICLDKPNNLQARLDNRPVHLEYLATLKAKLKIAGPFLAADNETPIGSLLIYDAVDDAEARSLAENDPFAKSGVFGSIEIKAWRQGYGPAIG
jgi:uncharacterized protein